MAEVLIHYEGPIVTWKQAKTSGLKRYFGGKPCRRNHLAQRFTASLACVECRRMDRSPGNFNPPKPKLECQRVSVEGLPASPKAAREIGSAHYYNGVPCKHGHLAPRLTATSNCLRCQTLHGLRWQKVNSERFAFVAAAWRKANPDKVKAQSQRHWERHGAQNQRLRRAKNPEYSRTHCRNRQLRLRTSGKVTDVELQDLLKRQKFRCVYCKANLKKTGYHADHRIAITKGGTNSIGNIQCLCPPCNCSKSNRDHIAFAKTKGLLL